MKLALPQEDRSQLERWIKSRATPAKVKARARMVLMTADNRPTHEVMATLRVANKTLNSGAGAIWTRG